jgi:hypothetical protein
MELQPLDNYLVSIENKYVEEINLSNGLKLFFDPSFHPEKNVTIEGKIAGLPRNNTLNLSVNDTVMFSYVVIAQRDFTNVGHVFHSLFEKYNDDFQRFGNGKGEFITIVAFEGVISKIYACCHLDSRGQLIGEGMQGSFSQMERWKSQFTFESGGSYKYRNLIEIDGKELWLVKPEYVFGVKSGKKILSVGEKVILDVLDVPIPKDVVKEMNIKAPDSSLSARYYDRGLLTHYDKKTKLSKGEIVAFNPTFVEQYESNGKPFFLIKRKRIIGTYQKTN